MRRDLKIAFAIYVVATAIYASTSGLRLRRHSDDNHFVWLAHGWLHGRLDLGQPPPHSNDWAQVEQLTLSDGRELRGAMLQGSSKTFRTLAGDILQVDPSSVSRRSMKYYVSFPPFPAAVMLPAVAIWGMQTNDVLFTVLLAGLAPALFFLLLRRLRGRAGSMRSLSDDLWLTGVLAVGSVYFYSSVIGQVWYTAHVVAVLLCILYVWFSLEARRPWLAGLCLAAGFLTRPQLLYAAPLFLWELARTRSLPEDDEARRLRALACAPLFPEAKGGWRFALSAPGRFVPRACVRLWFATHYGWHRLDGPAFLRGFVAFAIPIACFGGAAAVLNHVRFGRITEFGHTYLNVKWTPRIQKYGLFNYAFLARNLTCLLALTPRILGGPPWVQVSWHGLAIWVTTPVILWVLWPKTKGRLHTPLWMTVACIAIPVLFYQNSGWVQFGYRFALDYIVFLLCLMALGDRRFGAAWKTLVVVGVAVNLFGAITFGRAWQFYFDGYFPPGID